MKPWPKDATRGAKTKSCKVRATLKAETSETNYRSDLVMTYDRPQASVILLVRGAFGETQAKLQIQKSAGTFTDAQGSRPLSREPIFRELFMKNWTQGFDFILGIVTELNAPLIRANSQNLPVWFETPEKTIHCRYEPNAETPKACDIETDDLKIKIDFSFVECRESLS